MLRRHRWQRPRWRRVVKRLAAQPEAAARGQPTTAASSRAEATSIGSLRCLRASMRSAPERHRWPRCAIGERPRWPPPRPRAVDCPTALRRGGRCPCGPTRRRRRSMRATAHSSSVRCDCTARCNGRRGRWSLRWRWASIGLCARQAAQHAAGQCARQAAQHAAGRHKMSVQLSGVHFNLASVAVHSFTYTLVPVLYALTVQYYNELYVARYNSYIL